MEHQIIAAVIADRKSFDRVDPHLSQDDVSPEGAIVLKAIRQFYQTDPKAPSADIGLLKRAVLRSLTNPKHSEVFEAYFQGVEDQNVSAVNVVHDLLSMKEESALMQLAESILIKDTQRVHELLDRVEELRADTQLDGVVHEEYQGIDADELIDDFAAEHLIKIAPISLNAKLRGGALRGHHLVLVAYPETGKTLFAITMIGGFVYQGLKVLYIGNEDPIKSVMLRTVAHLSGKGTEVVRQDPQACMATAKARGYDNIVFAGLAGGTLEDVRALCAKHEPDVLIVDQIRNLSTKSENRTQQLEAVARGMRNIAREYNLLSVSITQGADSARGKLELDMGDVDGSNVGIPGTADVMIMIGMNDYYDEHNQRRITLAKNKIGGLHDSWTVGIKPDISRAYDIGNYS